MKGNKRTGVIVILGLFFLFYQQVSADWNVGNKRFSGFGVKANIWTPDTPLYIADSGESNWVSLPLPYWIQAGWRYYKDYEHPRRYVEYCVPPCGIGDRELNEYDPQYWGSIVEYKVDHYASTTWCASINGILKECQILTAAPAEMQVFSEIHVDSRNELDTRFSAVYYKTADGLWFLFDQENWTDESPYYVQKDEPYYFRTYRSSPIYLPAVFK
jgi:hypothetical protein